MREDGNHPAQVCDSRYTRRSGLRGAMLQQRARQDEPGPPPNRLSPPPAPRAIWGWALPTAGSRRKRTPLSTTRAAATRWHREEHRRSDPSGDLALIHVGDRQELDLIAEPMGQDHDDVTGQSTELIPSRSTSAGNDPGVEGERSEDLGELSSPRRHPRYLPTDPSGSTKARSASPRYTANSSPVSDIRVRMKFVVQLLPSPIDAAYTIAGE